MLIRLRQGQSQVAPYAVVFMIAIATVTVMSVYVRRAIQGRVYDASKYMVKTIAQEADLTIGGTTKGKSINYQYEPYYSDRESIKTSDAQESVQVKSGRYRQKSTQRSSVETKSRQ